MDATRQVSSNRFLRNLTLAFATMTIPPAASLTAQTQASAPANRVVGAITTVNGRTLTLKADSGTTTTLTVSDSARIVRMAPGVKTLAGATPIQITDLSVGDRVLAVTAPGADGSSLTATTVVAMKQADIAEKQNADREDWQKRGIGGLVKSVDPATQSIVITVGTKTIVVQAGAKTVVRRYDPNSIEFSAAQLSSFDQIHPGDQLRTRGVHSPDGASFSAEEIVAGTFRNIAATVVSVDAASNTVQATDIATKKPVTIHVDHDTQLHRLPAEVAQELAARAKHGEGKSPAPENAQAGEHAGPPAGEETHPGTAGDHGPRGGGDLSQILQRTPVITVADLHKGDAIMVVATLGTPAETTAVTLLAGVEPVLASSSSASSSVFSASWSGIGGGGDAGAQ